VRLTRRDPAIAEMWERISEQWEQVERANIECLECGLWEYQHACSDTPSEIVEGASTLEECRDHYAAEVAEQLDLEETERSLSKWSNFI
tara:strand:+ start:6300 stop:6566 length:267 start_codon:yes stop_codon:yes gene_type:complete